MIFLSVFSSLCFIFRLGDAVGLHGFHFRGLEEPDTSTQTSFENIIEAWIEQPVDHFNPRDNRTWSMRYYENSDHFEKGGPILIMIGGEWAISSGFLESGLMYELACAHNATMYYTEHRYYGKSRPTKDTSSTNLEYLSVDQALADLAYFIESKKHQDGLENSAVIVFGGSYAGSMATWSRLKYPHLIQGALASSAPLFAKADFYEYYEVVTESLRRYSQKCVDDVKAAFDAVQELFKTENGTQRLKEYFNLCDAPNVDSPNDVAHFMNILAEPFASIVQYDKVENGKTKIAACCESMTASYLGSPLQRLAYFVSTGRECLKNNYEKFVELYRKEAWDAQPDIMRQWFYQTCTEYGYFQTTNSKKSIFGSLFPLNYFTDICTDLYGDYYDNDFLNTRVERTNIMYGGVRPDLRNVIFTNGDVDPWHALSVLQDLNPSSLAILIKGSSHCRDLYRDSDTDGDDLVRARARVREIIGSWISS
ncbi:Putative serine protease K12H4.7 [Habropoda laboriosa]|uniref:Putative serine protease K12H4.7 n=1 Tax=Habropoda laboriosa TaxID=597456 RepID=A0A0L7QS79_9HYME|nr:PREDICTED: putative serine protease K12H4.7 [Habropoda laboriosa]KOC61505.1 Putative serine protease K12H4.7 [Habropoda laboriosa]